MHECINNIARKLVCPELMVVYHLNVVKSSVGYISGGVKLLEFQPLILNWAKCTLFCSAVHGILFAVPYFLCEVQFDFKSHFMN